METLNKNILDVCCGSRMFWFDKENPDVLFNDIRNEEHILCDGRELKVNPDTQHDFTNLPFTDNAFSLVVFDPPHLLEKKAGKNGWMRKKYGALKESWPTDLKNGFSECFRVLKPGGILIFKWSEIQIKVSEILQLTDKQPLFGHKSGKKSNTHWLCFINN